MGRYLIDETGNRYGKLTVIKRVDNTIIKNEVSIISAAKWLCKCDCGKEKIINGGQLRCGKAKSCGCSKILPFGESSFNVVFGSYKKGARRRNHFWGLSKDEFRYITSQPCFYCGQIPQQSGRKKGKHLNGYYLYNGIDRINNELGYIIDNVVPCCKRCNFAKSSTNLDSFRDWIKNVYNHWASQ